MNRHHTKFSLSRAAAIALAAALLLVGSLTAAYATDLGGFKKTVQIWVRGELRDVQVEAQRDDDVNVTVVIDNNDDEDVDGDVEKVEEFIATDAGDSPDVGQYTVTWVDDDGEVHTQGGGGVSIDHMGNETPITMDEFVEYLESSPTVEKADDGRVMLYWYDQAVDITDQFDADGVCEVTLERDGQAARITVTQEGDAGFGISMDYDGEEE